MRRLKSLAIVLDGQAMSVAINRDEINETAFFGMGEGKQYTGFTDSPKFLDKKWESHYSDYDPALANIDTDNGRQRASGAEHVLDHLVDVGNPLAPFGLVPTNVIPYLLEVEDESEE